MQKLFRCLILVAATAGVASSADAQELTVKIADGRATVIAKDVPLRQILAEWARVGDTRIVNAEKLTGGPISLELVDMPEKDVLDTLLRSAAGYLTGPRPVGAAGASLYDRVMILATSNPPATNAANFNPAPRPFRNRMPQPPPEEDDDDGEPGDQGPMPPPGMIQNPGFPGGPEGGPQTMPVPGQMPAVPNQNANPNMMPPGAMPPGAMPPDAMPPDAMPADATPPGEAPAGVPVGTSPPGVTPSGTAPRPGMLPPQPVPANPYSPLGRPPGAPPGGRGGGPGEPDDR
ncbi:MAG: hypothetical protein ACRD15_07560 [Vicinamibacterales bacterium]